MKYDSSILEKMDSLVKEAIDHGYDVLDFMEDVNYSMINAIHDGYIFENYLEQRNLVEDRDYVGFNPETENWEELIKIALKKKGINYDEEVERINKNNENFYDQFSEE